MIALTFFLMLLIVGIVSIMAAILGAGSILFLHGIYRGHKKNVQRLKQ